MLATLWLLSRWYDEPTRRRATIAGIAVGLPMVVKYNAIFLLAPAYLLDVWRRRPTVGWRALIPRRSFVIVLAVAAVTVLAACPFVWLDLARARFTAWFLVVFSFANRPTEALPPDAGWLEWPTLCLENTRVI